MLNMDFNKRVVIETQQKSWLESSQPGVFCIPLATEATAAGHVTSLVRYEAGASIANNQHGLGEEIMVVEGTVSDEDGDYPSGHYFRYPPGYFHTLQSKDGCVLLVKLHQFKNNDDQVIHVDTRDGDWYAGYGDLEVMPLHNFEGESTALVHWPAGAHFQPHFHGGGEEIYVLHGEFIDEHGRYPAGSWIRSPHMSKHDPYVKEDTLILVKVGHLRI